MNSAFGRTCVSPCPQPLVAAKGKGTIVDTRQLWTYVHTQLRNLRKRITYVIRAAVGPRYDIGYRAVYE